MKNLQFFLMFFMMVIVGQQEIVALQNKSAMNSSIVDIADCSCGPNGECDGCCQTGSDDED